MSEFSQSPDSPIIKITVLGKGIVGKSSLIFRFLNYKIPTQHDATIEDRYKGTVKINDKIYNLEILDTAGEEDFQNMIENWISFGDCFMIVFALNDLESLETAKTYYERIIKSKKNTKNIILVGNKQDLENERKIHYLDIKTLADKLKVHYIETSVVKGSNCKEAFEKIVNETLQSMRNISSSKIGGLCCSVF